MLSLLTTFKMDLFIFLYFVTFPLHPSLPSPLFIQYSLLHLCPFDRPYSVGPKFLQCLICTPFFDTRVVPKVMSNFFLYANWEQQTKESAVVDGTSCCVTLECLMTSIACITWPVSLLTKWPTTICPFGSVLSSNPCERGNPCCRNSPETSACLWRCVHGCEQCSKMGETF